MKLSAADLAIIADTLHRSLPIAGMASWMYSRETREFTLKNVLALMQEIEIEMTDSELTSQGNGEAKNY